MRGLIAYLDSSSIVKRYVEEPGSKTVRDVYLKAYTADLVVMDEAAFMPEDMIASVIFPMLATTNGTAIMLSTLGVETTSSTEASKTRIIGASM